MPSAKPFRDDSAGFLANHMARLFSRVLAKALAPQELAVAQFMVLLELWEEDGLTQRDLIQRLDVEQGTMNSTLNRMERDGLVVRRPHPTDKRAQTIHATTHATALQSRAIAAARGVNTAANAALSLAEQHVLISLMARVITALGQERDLVPDTIVSQR